MILGILISALVVIILALYRNTLTFRVQAGAHGYAGYGLQELDMLSTFLPTYDGMIWNPIHWNKWTYTQWTRYLIKQLLEKT